MSKLRYDRACDGKWLILNRMFMQIQEMTVKNKKIRAKMYLYLDADC